MFIRTTVASPPPVSEVWLLLSEAELPPDVELPLVLVQPAKVATARAKASTRLRIRFCIVFFLLCFYFFLSLNPTLLKPTGVLKNIYGTRAQCAVFSCWFRVPPFSARTTSATPRMSGTHQGRSSSS